MANLRGFDANVVPPFGGFVPLPVGDYVACIIQSERKLTRDGTGEYLQLKICVIEGEHHGQILWSRLNLRNRNPEAVKIAESQLSSICRAVGVLQPVDSSDLHDRPLMIRVVCKKRSDTGVIVNEITGYSKLIQSPTGRAPVPGTPWNS